MKLSRILSNQNGVSRQQANALIAAGRAMVNGEVCTNASLDVDGFTTVAVDDNIIQPGSQARYLMLNKPAGYLSATVDAVHPTVLDLIAPDLRESLHIAGRLDRATTGLLILTNDGTWSRRLTEPRVRIPKVYRVTTAYPLSPDTEARFAAGIWFEYEQLTTSPAHIEQMDATNARLTIYEGRYHQVKRMFHAVGNRVVSLHREQMGAITLDGKLQPGEYRALSHQETQSIPRR
ncbi:pseudouridine synthase [uncultured Marinobacter sp.]|uniref:pseudouridine synthase n=1 Tax=uncultured Marinobacter sp. TaxID=187379 RepID=UPI002626DDFE|nr:pseudouridine synthase [uncultured Marinobacter sp.]